MKSQRSVFSVGAGLALPKGRSKQRPYMGLAERRTLTKRQLDVGT